MAPPKERGNAFIFAQVLLEDSPHSDADDEYTVLEQTNLN